MNTEPVLKKYLHCLFIVLLLCSLSIKAVAVQYITAPAKDRPDSILAVFESKFIELDTLIFPKRIINQQRVERLPFVHPDSVESFNSVVNARIAAFKSQSGLVVSGQTYYRPQETTIYDNDDPQGLYIGKVQAEIGWDFLHSSLNNRKENIRLIQLEGELDEVEYSKASREQTIAKQKEYYRQKYDILLAGVLMYHRGNLVLLYDAQRYLLETESISSDELLRIINDRADIERQLSMIPEPHNKIADLSQPFGAIITIDTAALKNSIVSTNQDLYILELRNQIIGHKIKTTNYLSEAQLTPFVRYSYYFRQDYTKNTGNMDAGINFKLPLLSGLAKKRKALNQEHSILNYKGEQIKESISVSLKILIEEIERYNNAILGEFNRIKSLKEYLKMRTNAYNNRYGEYSRLARMKEYNTYLSCWEKLLSYQYQRDCRLVELQQFLINEPLMNYCNISQLK